MTDAGHLGQVFEWPKRPLQIHANITDNFVMSSAARSLKPLAGIGALLLGALAAAGPAGAQAPVPQCDGKDATIIKTEWTAEDQYTGTDFDTDFGFVNGGTTGILGTAADDVIVASNNPEMHTLIRGLEGNDTICLVQNSTGVTGSTTVAGDDGDDVIFNMPDAIFRVVTIVGGAGNDTIHGSNGGDLIEAGPGDDTIFGYQGQNIIYGQEGNDVIRGGRDLDIVAGGDGDDTIYGGQYTDILYGGLGKDTIFGGAGDDLVVSNDDFIGSHEYDFEFRPDAGPEPGRFNATTPSFSQDTAGGRMFGGIGNDIIIGSNRWDRMQGGAGDDLLLGMEGRDWMRGGTGNDIILGGGGIDDINGNQGNDEIILHSQDIGHGGFGLDTCTTGLAGTANPTLRSCENQADIDTQWPELAERINQSWEIDIAIP